MKASILAFLEQVRATAQSGLHHAQNPYDRDRYRRIFELSLGEYSLLTGMDIEEVRSIFLRESGTIIPKSAASGAIFNDNGEILLIRRADNGRLTMPGGACEPGESPQETAVREVKEETGLTIEAHHLWVFLGSLESRSKEVQHDDKYISSQYRS